MHPIGTGAGQPGVSTAEAARQLWSWLAREADPALTGIQTWRWTPTPPAGLSALAVSVTDVGALHATAATARQACRAGGEAGR